VHHVALDDMRRHHVLLVEGLRRRRKEEVGQLIALHVGLAAE
jgi:hypothetical protein